MNIPKIFFFLLISCCNSYTQISVQETIDSLVKDSSLRYASISFHLTECSNGNVIASYQPELALTTASTMKMITTSTALASLGGDFRFETWLQYDGIVKDSVLEGNLFLKGFGDPSFGSSNFDEQDPSKIGNFYYSLLNQLGIKKINGNLIADDSYFDSKIIVDSWQWMDMGNGYGAGVSALNFYDNIYFLKFKQTNEIGQQAQLLDIQPAQKDKIFLNRVIIADKNSGDQVNVYTSPLSNQVVLEGSIPAGKKNFTVKAAASNPSFYACNWLYEFLQNKGIFFTGQPLQIIENTTTERKLLGKWYSPPLSKLITLTNEYSLNMYSEAFLKKLGSIQNEKGSTWNGIKYLYQFWKNKGIDLNGIYFTDGSGLSSRNAVNSLIFTQILNKIHQDSLSFPGFYDMLAIYGKTGTFRNMGKKTLLENNLHGKGGSMIRVRSTCGYITAKNAKRYSFSFIANNFNCSPAYLRDKMNQLFLKIAEIEDPKE